MGPCCFAILFETSATVSAKDSWQVGIATARITPKEPIWMAGYADRDRPVETTLTDLWLKVAALKAADSRMSNAGKMRNQS